MKKQIALAILAFCSAKAVAQFSLTVVNGYGSGMYTQGSTVHIWSNTTKTLNRVFADWSSGTPGLSIADPKAWHTDIIMPAQDLTVTATSSLMPAGFNLNAPNTNNGLKKVVVPGALVGMTVTPQITTFGTPAFSQTVNTPVGMTSTVVSTKLEDRDTYYYFPQNMKGVVYFFHWTNGTAKGWIESSERFEMVKNMISHGYGVIIPNSEERERRNANSNPAYWDIEPDGVTRFVHMYQNITPTLTITQAQLEDYMKHQYDIYALARIHNYFVNQNLMPSDVCEFGIGFSAGAGFAPVAAYKLGYKAVACIGNAGHENLFLNTPDYTTPTIFSYGVKDGYDPFTQQFQISAKVAAHCAALSARGVPNENHPIDPSPVHPKRFTNVFGIGDNLSNTLYTQMVNGGLISLNAVGQATFNMLAPALIDSLTAAPAIFPAWHNLANDVQNNAENVIYNICAGHSVNSQHDFKIATFFNQFATCNSANRLTKSETNTDMKTLESIRLYPNPTYDYLRIERKDNLPLTYTIFDSAGKLILKGSLDKNDLEIITESLSKGIYMISMSGEGFEKVEKFVKE